jgi:hypothetical protein
VFHAQTEQRFNADNHSTPADVNAEAQRLLDCDLLVVRNTRYPQRLDGPSFRVWQNVSQRHAL